MKTTLWILVFLLPLHAFLVTVLKCKFGLDTNILRFWKEIIIWVLAVLLFVRTYSAHKWSLKSIYKNNTILGLTTAFILCSAFYVYFPFMQFKPASVLGFRYDAFFFVAMIVWLYVGFKREDLKYLLRNLFLVSAAIITIFLPWYLFWDISAKASLFGYSGEVSTYSANGCISFSQNVDGEHRFQWSFGWPIRFSVFLTIVWSLFAGWILVTERFSLYQKYSIGGIFWLGIVLSIFFSYSKTSLLGLLFAGATFYLLTHIYIYRKKITRKFYIRLAWAVSLPIVLVALFKWELFLHLWAVINRLDNIGTGIQMFFYNPYGYGLGIAGPASQIGNSIESAGSWEIAANTTQVVHKFLPENWYLQILLEQWIIGFVIFISLIIYISVLLLTHLKKHRDFMSVWITTAYFSLLFMALFTHAFEEAATSYILFLIIGIHLSYLVDTKQQHA